MSTLYQHVQQMSREKGVDSSIIIAAVEDAVLTAAKKFYKTEEPYQARFNQETGQVEVFILKTVVDIAVNENTEISLREARVLDPSAALGAQLEVHKSTEKLGRIAAQAAKQVIFQKVREAERHRIFSEYTGRVGELITGIVKREEAGDLFIDIGKTEAVLLRRDQSRAELFNLGERVRTVITRVTDSTKGPQISVSRTEPSLLAKLFEKEVPEIAEGIVVVKDAVREPGDRAKVAVYSVDKAVDPVGACVGVKGARVQNVMRELRGEKIDVVEWQEEPVHFAANVLNPAQVSSVAITDSDARILEVIVEDNQLSLAIGKRGQNVRLAARLLGWRIDIKSKGEIEKVTWKPLNSAEETPEDVLVESAETSNKSVDSSTSENGKPREEALAMSVADEVGIGPDAAESGSNRREINEFTRGEH